MAIGSSDFLKANRRAAVALTLCTLPDFSPACQLATFLDLLRTHFPHLSYAR